MNVDSCVGPRRLLIKGELVRRHLITISAICKHNNIKDVLTGHATQGFIVVVVVVVVVLVVGGDIDIVIVDFNADGVGDAVRFGVVIVFDFSEG